MRSAFASQLTEHVMNPVKVILHGFDQRAADRIKNLFLINYRGKCVLATGENADVSLVDLDGLGERADALLASLEPGRTILLSEREQAYPGFEVLGKPVKLQLLWEALQRASRGVVQGAGSEAAPVEKVDAVAPPESRNAAADGIKARFRVSSKPEAVHQVRKLGKARRYRPGDYFIGSVLEALSLQGGHRAVQLTTWEQKRLVFHPESNRIYTDLRKSQFRSLAATPLAEPMRQQIRMETLASLPMRGELEGMEELDLTRTVWELAYGTSRGRVPEDLDVSGKYSLRRWPNFTRLPDVPNGMRIAAVWATEPQRLDDIAARLGIEVEEVYAFYAGAAALGLSACAEQVVAPVVQRRQSAPSRGLLGALLGHLGAALGPRGGLAREPLGDQA